MPKNALNITRAENFPDWYQEVVSRAELAESSAVRGCFVIRPYGFAIWENIKKILDKKIKDLGVQNAYFPLLIPIEFFEREAEHVEGFAKECAVVTHHRLKSTPEGLEPDGELERPYIIRPTSETIIGESFSRWIQSYRDLPMKINQWANVIRWEMRPRVFLRTSEFLWQEGHNVFETPEEAEEDARKMLLVYQDLMENYLAISGILGRKTEDEKFPGAVNTYTIESMMQDGKALQSCTAHNLGQNFTKASAIKFTDKDGQEKYAYSTSWGATTRLIGALIMSHSDDDGLVLPPEISPYKAVVIPTIHDEDTAAEIMEYCQKLKSALGDEVLIDDSHKRTPDKKWDWVRKGVPIIAELGMRELNENKIFFSGRDKLSEKKVLNFEEFTNSFRKILNGIHSTLVERSRERIKNVIKVDRVGEVAEIFKEKTCFVSIAADWWGDKELEEIMKEYSVSYRCYPFEDEERIIIGKSY